MPGRLIVKVKKSSGIDESLGIETGSNPSDTVFAEVYVTCDEAIFPVGCTVMYDRVHSKGLKLEHEGEVSEYKVVQTADISLIIQ